MAQPTRRPTRSRSRRRPSNVANASRPIARHDLLLRKLLADASSATPDRAALGKAAYFHCRGVAHSLHSGAPLMPQPPIGSQATPTGPMANALMASGRPAMAIRSGVNALAAPGAAPSGAPSASGSPYAALLRGAVLAPALAQAVSPQPALAGCGNSGAKIALI